MTKTITINLSGQAFLIEERAYTLLDTYLSEVRSSLGNQPDNEETMADIEYRIAELLRVKCPTALQLITSEMVEDVKSVMGMPNDFDNTQSNKSQDSNAKSKQAEPPQQPLATKQLSRDVSNKILGGVCSGIANYFEINVTVVRLLCLLMVFIFGISILVYIALWVVIPVEISFKQSHQFEASNRLKNSNYKVYSTGVNMRPLGILFGAVFILISTVVFTVLAIVFYKGSNLFDVFITDYNIDRYIVYLDNKDQLVIALFCLLTIPFLVMFINGVKLLFDIKASTKFLSITFLLLWIGSLIMFIFLVVSTLLSIEVKSSQLQVKSLDVKSFKKLYVQPSSDETDIRTYKNFKTKIELFKKTYHIRSMPELIIQRGSAFNVELKQTIFTLKKPVSFYDINDLIVQNDSVIRIKTKIENGEGVLGKNIQYILQIPDGMSLEIDSLLKVKVLNSDFEN